MFLPTMPSKQKLCTARVVFCRRAVIIIAQFFWGGGRARYAFCFVSGVTNGPLLWPKGPFAGRIECIENGWCMIYPTQAPSYDFTSHSPIEKPQFSIIQPSFDGAA